MIDLAIRVLTAGALTSVQDLGRFGYQSSGIPCSGVMDQQAYKTANRLLGNSSGNAVLELTMFGGTYLFDTDTTIVLTGADMHPAMNQNPCPMYRPVLATAGSVLSFGFAVSGCRTYLAVNGGIDVPEVLGSRSTNLKCGFGGYQGRALRAGDVIRTGEPQLSHTEILRQAKEHPARNVKPVYPSDVTVRVIEGPQAEYFTEYGLHTFYSGVYTVSGQSDRMGCRMDGPAVESIHGTDIISDGIVFGSVQVTSAGQPIVLMADRQTTGGYAKIATVCSRDLPVLAQCCPGCKVHFKKTELSDIMREEV